MQRLRQRMANARDGTNQVCARTQVSDFTQILNAVAFCRHRVSVWIFNPTSNFNLAGLNFKLLPLARRCHDFTRHNDRATGGQTQDVFIVIGQRIIDDSLYRIKAGTVINGEEGDASF